MRIKSVKVMGRSVEKEKRRQKMVIVPCTVVQQSAVSGKKERMEWLFAHSAGELESQRANKCRGDSGQRGLRRSWSRRSLRAFANWERPSK